MRLCACVCSIVCDVVVRMYTHLHVCLVCPLLTSSTAGVFDIQCGSLEDLEMALGLKKEEEDEDGDFEF